MTSTMLQRIIRAVRRGGLAGMAVGVLMTSGCSTVEGLGEDIQSAGVSTKEAIADATGASSVHDKGSVEGQGSGRER